MDEHAKRWAKFFGVPDDALVHREEDEQPTPEQIATVALPALSLPQVKWMQLPPEAPGANNTVTAEMVERTLKLLSRPSPVCGTERQHHLVASAACDGAGKRLCLRCAAPLPCRGCERCSPTTPPQR